MYFPPGTYRISKPVIQYYYSQFIGNPHNLPVIKALPNFQGIALIDSDPYIPGGDGAQWYTNQNNFFRQVRNFVIDVTAMPPGAGTGIHWQIAQATSLQNIRFEMRRDGSSENKQQGIFMENGSGGFMTDLTFNGGLFGAFWGNQQFTTRNLTFNYCQTGIFMNWNWVWTIKSATFNSCGLGIDMANSPSNQTVGSVLVLDSRFRNTSPAIKTAFSSNSTPETGGTLVIDNVDFNSAKVAVVDASKRTVLDGGRVVDNWVQGAIYRPSAGDQTVDTGPSQATMPAASCGHNGHLNATIQSCTAPPSPKTRQRGREFLNGPQKPTSLLSGGKVFERARPQYEDIPTSSFISVKSRGAKGDGVSDDTAAIQRILDEVDSSQIVYFDHGAYVITDTVNVPPNIRITGEILPLIMAAGEAFSDSSKPRPVFRVGQPGQRGSVEMSDLIFETRGPAPGAIMIEWNIAQVNQGSVGMWDVHVRIGGTAGTELQIDKCQKNETIRTEFDPECAGAFMMMHITEQASAYLENTWFWVADHELDLSSWPDYDVNNQINIYNGRGILVESQGPVWLYGTSSEHSVLYNYQIDHAIDFWMGAIQTETAYMQSNPNALNSGFKPDPRYNDPEFSDCDTELCRKTWGVRILESKDVYLYGGGCYSFFENYRQQCLDTESCQENMIEIQCSDDVWLFGLSTKASINMVTVNGQGQAIGLENDNNFCQTLALFENQE